MKCCLISRCRSPVSLDIGRNPLRLYEANNTEEPCAGKPHAGICERAVGKLAVLSRLYKKLQEALEDSEDIKDIEASVQAIQEGKEITVPGEVTFAVLDDVNPIRAWREYKQIKMNELAKKVGISSVYLSKIENKKRNPTIDTLKEIARALNLEIEMLI